MSEENNTNKLIMKLGSVMGIKLATLEDVVKDRVFTNLQTIMNNAVLHDLNLDGHLFNLPSSCQLYNTFIVSEDSENHKWPLACL